MKSNNIPICAICRKQIHRCKKTGHCLNGYNELIEYFVKIGAFKTLEEAANEIGIPLERMQQYFKAKSRERMQQYFKAKSREQKAPLSWTSDFQEFLDWPFIILSSFSLT
jgi:hypothetical protein